MTEALPDAFRPDHLGVMLSFEKSPINNHQPIIVARAFNKSCSDAYGSADFRAASAIVAKQGLNMWISFGHSMMPFDPDKTTAPPPQLTLGKVAQSRNALCNCGSQLRYKSCHGRFTRKDE